MIAARRNRPEAALMPSRERIEDIIENLVALLDIMDGDCDEEPYLSGFFLLDDDRELEDENDEHGGDDEPYLAGFAGDCDDLEDDLAA